MSKPVKFESIESRYEVEHNKAFNCWIILDVYNFEEVCNLDKKEDADIICQCLNVIKYER